MALTPISPDLIHDVEAVDTDKEILERLCNVAEMHAAPLVRRALIRETAANGASAWIEDARQMLRLLQDEETAYRSDSVPLTDDEAAIKQHLAQSIEAGQPMRPDEDEVRLHAAELSRAMMTNWVQVVRDRVAAWDPSRPLLPFSTIDKSPEWARFWEAVSLFVVNPGEVEAILRSTCEEILREAEVAESAEIRLPLGVTLLPGMLKFSLEMTGPEMMQRILERMQDIVSIAFVENPASEIRKEPASAARSTLDRVRRAVSERFGHGHGASEHTILGTARQGDALANLLLPKEWQETIRGHKLVFGSKHSVDSNAWTAIFQDRERSK